MDHHLYIYYCGTTGTHKSRIHRHYYTGTFIRNSLKRKVRDLFILLYRAVYIYVYIL